MGRWLRLRGFTLIELMIAVAVVAILAAIAWPSYANYVLRSKVRLAQGDLAALVANVENHRQRTRFPTVRPGPWVPTWAVGTRTCRLSPTAGRRVRGHGHLAGRRQARWL